MTQTIRNLAVFPLTLALALSVGAPAFAQNVEIDVAGDVRVDNGSALNASSSAGAEVSDNQDDTTPEPDASAGSGSSGAIGFSLERGDVSVVNSNGAAIAPASVNSESDLEAYAASALSANEALEGVEAASEKLVLRFKEDARFLGIFPFSMTSRVEVEQDGSVRVVRPWYSFLATGVESTVAADIETRVRGAMNAEEGIAMSGEMSSRAQALVLAELVAALNGSAAASTQASSNAETNNGSIDAEGSLRGEVEVAPN